MPENSPPWPGLHGDMRGGQRAVGGIPHFLGSGSGDELLHGFIWTILLHTPDQRNGRKVTDRREVSRV